MNDLGDFVRRLTRLEQLLARLMTADVGGVRVSTADTSNPPTLTQLNSAFGTAAAVGAGFVGLLDDAGGGANVYLVASDGSNWWYVALTLATDPA